MPKHKSSDYKLTAVQYYLVEDKTQEEVCKIFKCSPRSLMRWVDKYKKDGEYNQLGMNQSVPKVFSIGGGFAAGYFALSESLFNHSKTTNISKEDYKKNVKLQKKIISRHNTMRRWLNVDMNYAKRKN